MELNLLVKQGNIQGLNYNDNKEYIIHNINQSLFINACLDGHLEAAKWIVSVNPNIDISCDNECAFTSACSRGYLELAKWLLSIHPTIDISVYNELAFRGACNSGHLEVAKWLLLIKPTINISAENDFAFRTSCTKGYLDMAKWLQTILPYGYKYTFQYDEYAKKITTYSTKNINYKAIQNRLDNINSGQHICIREALVRECFHPKNMEKWIGWGQEDETDFIGME